MIVSGIATALEEFNEPKTAFTRYQAQYLVFLGVSVLIYAWVVEAIGRT